MFMRFFVMAGLLLARPVLGAPVAAVAPDYLLLVSIDGLAWDQLTAQGAHLPTLQRLRGQGASGPLESVFPSMTWAAHASLLTGQLPMHHGVAGNRYFDRAAGKWVECAEKRHSLLHTPTLADAAASKGWQVAALFWPNTGGAPAIHWNLPEVYGRRDFEQHTNPSAQALLREVGVPPLHLPRIGGEESFFMDSLTRDLTVRLVTQHKPRVVLAHLLSVDTAAHGYGPGTPPQKWALELVDRLIADMLAAYEKAGLGQRVAVVLVSDHGFLPVTRGVSVPRLAAGLKVPGPVRNGLRIMANGHALFVYATTAASTAGLPAVAEALRKHADFERIVTEDGFAALGLARPKDDPNFPDLIALARPEVLLWNGREASRAGVLPMYGMHGYLPNHPALQGIFIAAGPGAARGKALLGLRAIDVAPTLARWLGLAMPAAADGQARTDVLEAAKTGR